MGYCSSRASNDSAGSNGSIGDSIVVPMFPMVLVHGSSYGSTGFDNFNGRGGSKGCSSSGSFNGYGSSGC